MCWCIGYSGITTCNLNDFTKGTWEGIQVKGNSMWLLRWESSVDYPYVNFHFGYHVEISHMPTMRYQRFNFNKKRYLYSKWLYIIFFHLFSVKLIFFLNFKLLNIYAKSIEISHC